MLNEIIDFTFDGGNRSYIGFNEYKLFWMKNRKGNNHFSRNRLKAVVDHLLMNTYIEVGNILVRQSIGVPMGID